MAKIEVIVTESGFYGGTWFDEANKPQPMEERVAQAFMAPRGHQLALPAAAAKTEPAPPKTPVKTPEDKA